MKKWGKSMIVICAIAVITISIILILTNMLYIKSRRLVLAITNDDLAAVERIIKRGADVNIPEYKNIEIFNKITESSPRAPLSTACKFANYDIIELIVESGANVEGIKGTGWGPMHNVFLEHQESDVKTIELLLKNGANPNFTESDPDVPNSEKPIFMVTKYLLNEFDAIERMEAESNSLKIFKLLESYGAEITCLAENGNNVMLIAALQGKKQILEYLLKEKKFDVNYRNNQGATSLMLSVFLNGEADREIISLLFEYGANKDFKDVNGKTAYDYAMDNGNEDIAELLKIEK